MSVFVEEKQAQARAMSLLLAQRVRDYFKSEQHRTEFEAWYIRKYGVPYQWKSLVR